MAKDERLKRNNRHHRLPRSRGGKNNPDNISIVKQDVHRAYHLMFGNATPEELAAILNLTWIDPDKKLVVVENEDYYLIQQILERRRRK